MKREPVDPQDDIPVDNAHTGDVDMPDISAGPDGSSDVPMVWVVCDIKSSKHGGQIRGNLQKHKDK